MAALLQPWAMPKNRKDKVTPHFKPVRGLPLLTKWRQYRNKMTQEKLAELAGVSPGLISQLENGGTNYTQPTLEALSGALQCAPGELLSVDPTRETALWSLWDTASPADRARIVAMTEALQKTGS